MKSKGFTLLELMIGSGVLVVALTGLIGAYTGCFLLNESARNLTIALNDAQAVMEEIRSINIPFYIIQEDWTNWAATEPPDGGGCNSLDNERIEVTYPSGIEARPLEVLITVNWSQRNRPRNVQLITLVTER